ncbi:MAG: hypothetical protein C0504_00955 [Candidatus Solibacter sp.]|nr:hypothetical protein [Candidatus Solibacter sp.]
MNLRQALAALGILILISVPGFGQTIHGSLTGTVLDQSGAVIPNADVVVKSLDQGTVRELKTDMNGFWRVPSLLPGRYQLEVASKGFGKIIRGPIQVEAAVERQLNVELSPSATSEVVTVTAEAPLIEATRSQISRGVETRRILTLPGLNTQNGLALLQPGAVANTTGPGSGLVVNGARSRSNNYMLDGANNNDQSLSIPRQSIAPEALGEFRIITNNFSAEFGRNSGAIVQQNTKSGTNEFHGIARWSWQGNGLNALTTGQQRTFNAQKTAGASDYIALRRSRAVQVDHTGVIAAGGPLVKDKHYFFSTYERNWFRSSAVPITTAFAPEAIQILEQNASFFAPGVVNFIKNTWPVANDPTSQGSVNVALPDGRTLALARQQYNRATAEGGAISYAADFHRGLMRTDHRISNKDNLFVRYLVDNTADPYGGSGIQAIPINNVGFQGRTHNLSANHVRVFTPTLVSEARFSYARREAAFPENQGVFLSISGLPGIGNQNFPQGRTDNVYEWTNNWSWTKGRHTMRFGGNYMYYHLDSFFAPNSRGTVQYTSISNLLFDRDALWSRYAGNGNVDAKTHEMQFFFADDYRLTNTFTLNIGARYEYTSAPFGFFSNAKPDANNWAPRLGFAWAPRGKNWLTGGDKFVLRGGYAITYDQVFQNILLNNARNFPRGVSINDPAVSGRQLWVTANQPAALAPDEFVKRGGNPLLLAERLFSPNERITQPYSQQMSMGIERQFGNSYVFKLFYVGTRGLKLVREVERNLGFATAAIAANPALLGPITANMKPVTGGVRSDPTRGSILIGDGMAMSNYHSMQTTVEKRFSSGLQFEVNYTWSTYISESDDILGGQTNRTLPSTPFNLRLDRGRSIYDVPHRLVANYVYQFPDFAKDNALLNRFVGGWLLSGITTFQQGLPYSVLNSNNALGILPGQISTVQLSQRASYNASGAPFTATPSPNARFIANATNSGVIGNLGANTERVGDTYNFNVGLSKDFRTFGEHQKLQFRWEISNLFNYRSFTAIPARNVDANTNLTQFMNLGFTNVGGRSMVFALRYEF